ncbi:hypothetical protein BLNAU_16318 [Blattamonas nauphoetae]|uniref:Uncharacterized protein n=1 Tax=Blattamonas nauphoetae TaxID=2049346 RepID=A0ABQ9XBZ4_9EUKA|nr:hypothetical protein BLNAU_16318 [Blattamonas nauphoetae]
MEITLDSNPRTTLFFVDGQSADVVVVDLPESVRIGFSANDTGTEVRFDRITNLNRAIPFTDQMTILEWPADKPLQDSESKENSDRSYVEKMKQ